MKHLYKQQLFNLLIVSSLILFTGCASESEERKHSKQFGAIYEDRSYIPQTEDLKLDAKINNKNNITNQKDFLNQLALVQDNSVRLSTKYQDTYQKVINWVTAGADIEHLERFNIDVQQMRGKNGFQNVLFTGYYSPVIKAKKKKHGEYKYPIYGLPKKKYLTRAEIYNGKLHKKGLELAYTKSLLDNFFLGVQGSGYLDFGNEGLHYFAYAGKNGHPYISIGRLLVEKGLVEKAKMSMQAIRNWANNNHPAEVRALLEGNPSYVFFKHDPAGAVKGAAGIPLLPMASVASDRKIIPSGSILLVEVPQIDEHGNWLGHHSLHLMMALDVGGAIKGQHLDLYQGIGENAGHVAGLLKHYGRVWVLQ